MENEIINTFKNTKRIAIVALLIILIVLVVASVVVSLSVKNFTIEVKEAKFSFDTGIEKIEEGIVAIKQQVESGNKHTLSLKEDAFSVIDDTSIVLDDGFNDFEIEEALNNHKYDEKGIIDGDFKDQKNNIKKFNRVWGIEEGISTNIDDDFIDRLTYTHKQHIYRINWNYFNQRSVPIIGNVICVPSSAVFLLNALGYNVEIDELLSFFTNNKQINDYARSVFDKWIESYIKGNKLYQITGTFTYGLNLFIETYYPDCYYRIDYDYWSIEGIAEYVEKFGLMSATFLPHWVLKGERTGGHMVVISKVYRDFEGNIIAFGINDPFGNPNVGYKGSRGWDGKNIIISLDDMRIVMKSYRDDHNKGSKELYRVLYFKDKE
ncbi:MAG: hypothetical protein AMQ22_01085 [Candidatus Methanofastidiosum methylothiophilum]|uniref:Uncharacterized protein n=1 Tax=Candidatus Methanofastidiosum methylothiophilum TaxID=1705564 RepID=A0A150J407_9EURY|nr:MAG: hypothetical protein AMQ22_01085 [Candidatus Methanofastidiosum methylthiophilus]